MQPRIETQRTSIAIVGAGPAGLMLAIELGCRGVDCVVLEEDGDDPIPPKANATSARTMEHYRRRGFAHDVRAVGLTEHHPQDVIYCTRLAGSELARFAIPSRADAAARRNVGDMLEARWPTPELPHRGNQMFIEPILRREVRRYPSASIRFNARATGLHQRGDEVGIDVADTRNGLTSRLEAAYVVGCDGARSAVREAMQVGYEGVGREQRAFFGGQMLGTYFRAPGLYRLLGERAWTWWVCNPEQRAVLVAIDGVDRFILGIQLRPGQEAADVDLETLIGRVAREPFAFEILDQSTWNAGYMLVAEQMRAGRLLIAGDAAHLFTPTGGMGYNTSVDDAVNLGWKLAAVMQGWAPESLLDTYEQERKPVAKRNTAFARRMADSIGRIAISPEIEADGAVGEAARAALGAQLHAHAAAEFNVPGIQLGTRYESPIVASEPGRAPEDQPNLYLPSGYPGGRAPHVQLHDGTSIFDRLGRDFTLLSFLPDAGASWREASISLGMPLDILHWPDPASADAARALYGADLILLRPDHHVAWRGRGGGDPGAVLARAAGRASIQHAKVAEMGLDRRAGA